MEYMDLGGGGDKEKKKTPLLKDMVYPYTLYYFFLKKTNKQICMGYKPILISIEPAIPSGS